MQRPRMNRRCSGNQNALFDRSSVGTRKGVCSVKQSSNGSIHSQHRNACRRGTWQRASDRARNSPASGEKITNVARDHTVESRQILVGISRALMALNAVGRSSESPSRSPKTPATTTSHRSSKTSMTRAHNSSSATPPATKPTCPDLRPTRGRQSRGHRKPRRGHAEPDLRHRNPGAGSRLSGGSPRREDN